VTFKTAKNWIIGAACGAFWVLIVVLATGFMVEATSDDGFCGSCHVMKPFRTAWSNTPHGGQNQQGVTAQCVDCHLPHGNFVEYLVAKGISGTSDVINNMLIDGATFGWEANAENRRHKFTFDSACRHCHQNLTGLGLSAGGFIAHRTYLRGKTDKMCTNCRAHVGHKDMLQTVDRF